MILKHHHANIIILLLTILTMVKLIMMTLTMMMFTIMMFATVLHDDLHLEFVDPPTDRGCGQEEALSSFHIVLHQSVCLCIPVLVCLKHHFVESHSQSNVGRVPHFSCHGLEDVLEACCLWVAHAGHPLLHLLVEEQQLAVHHVHPLVVGLPHAPHGVRLVQSLPHQADILPLPP